MPLDNSIIEAIPELEKVRKRWYFTDAIAFEIVKILKGRESVFLSTKKFILKSTGKPNKIVQRQLKINAVRFLYWNMERYKFFDGVCLYNLYHTVGYFPEMPMASFKPEDKAKQRIEFTDNHLELIKGYDLFIDIDNEIDFAEVYYMTKKTKAIFDEYKIRYHLKFSGTKGFHIIVLYEDFPEELRQIPFIKDEGIFNFIGDFVSELRYQYKIWNIDSTIFDSRRYCKTPYSVAYPYYLVALPLSDEQFDIFTKEMVFLPNLIDKAESFRNRGLLTREGKKEGLLNLMRDLAEKTKKRHLLWLLMVKKPQFFYSQMQRFNLL